MSTELLEFQEKLIADYPWDIGERFMGVNKDGSVFKFGQKPDLYSISWMPQNGDKADQFMGFVEIPSGIDWKDCLFVYKRFSQ